MSSFRVLRRSSKEEFPLAGFISPLPPCPQAVNFLGVTNSLNNKSLILVCLIWVHGYVSPLSCFLLYDVHLVSHKLNALSVFRGVDWGWIQNQPRQYHQSRRKQTQSSPQEPALQICTLLGLVTPDSEGVEPPTLALVVVRSPAGVVSAWRQGGLGGCGLWYCRLRCCRLG